MTEQSEWFDLIDAKFELLRKEADLNPVVLPKVNRLKRSVGRILYLPIESKARELRSKAIIARQAAERGFKVVLGNTWALVSAFKLFSPGVILFKTLNALDANNIALWVQHGHMTAALDEEMFGVHPTPEYLMGTVHPAAVDAVDVLCVQGENHAGAFADKSKIRITGNPRVLTYPKSKATGGDILVCNAAGTINHTYLKTMSRAEFVERMLRWAPSPMNTPNGRAWRDLTKEWIAWELTQRDLFATTVQALSSAFPDRRIRIRPHPAESWEAWRVGGNVVMDRSDSITTALSGAELMLYVSGCTTGLDANLSGVPALRLGSGGFGVSARINLHAPTPEDAIKLIKDGAVRWRQEDLSAHFAPVTIMDTLERLYAENAGGPEPALTKVPIATPNEGILRKFPTTSAAEISALAGRPATELSWNLFAIG